MTPRGRRLLRSANSAQMERFRSTPTSDVYLLGDCERVIDLDAEIANRTLHFRVPERARVIMHILLSH
jgi:hypothetical protein